MVEIAEHKGQISTLVAEALPLSRNRESLAWCPSDKNVDLCEHFFRPLVVRRHVAKVWRVWVVVIKNGRRKLVDFAERNRLPTKTVPSNRRRLNSATYGEVFHQSNLEFIGSRRRHKSFAAFSHCFAYLSRTSSA